MATQVLLVDYGGVISRPQPSGSVAAMAALVGIELSVFEQRYWEHRPQLDRGLPAREYWSIVAGRELDDQGIIEQLAQIDLASWSHFNDDTLDLLEEAHERGFSLSVLSNAPRDMAAVLHGHPALAHFDHLLFSSEIGAVKPEPAAFQAALDALARDPAEVLFIDDRPDNVAAAQSLGLAATLFTSADQLRSELFA